MSEKAKKRSLIDRIFNRQISHSEVRISIPRIEIPEPTRSLLWFTDEDTSKIKHAGSLTINISISIENNEPKVNVNSGKEYGLNAEPSMIWLKLPREINNDLESRPMYYPSYSQLYPKNRFQYLTWLTDIRKPTNLSYVFLYYYGLERHLLLGNYDGAVEEIKRLLFYHNQGSFRSYAVRSLLAASLYHKRPDILERVPTLLEDSSNLILVTRLLAKIPFRPDDIIASASKAGFTNKRYIKLYPDLFKQKLQETLDDFEKEHGSLLETTDLNSLPTREEGLFANLSIPDKYSQIRIPQLLEDKKYLNIVFELLSKTHEKIKIIKLSKKPDEQSA